MDNITDTNSIEFGATKVYTPGVSVQNNILPPLDVLHNCITCRKGRRLPAEAMSNDDYHYRCTLDTKTHIGLKHRDNDCEYFIRKRLDIIMTPKGEN